jgi:hypothetical protein
LPKPAIFYTNQLSQAKAIKFVMQTSKTFRPATGRSSFSPRFFAFLLAFSLQPLAFSSPYAFTAPATMVTGPTAVLNGMATPNGLPTAAWFEWGTSAAYGNQTGSLDAGSGTGVVWLTNQITGMVSTNDYHFRLAVSNSVGVAIILA